MIALAIGTPRCFSKQGTFVYGYLTTNSHHPSHLTFNFAGTTVRPRKLSIKPRSYALRPALVSATLAGTLRRSEDCLIGASASFVATSREPFHGIVMRRLGRGVTSEEHIRYPWYRCLDGDSLAEPSAQAEHPRNLSAFFKNSSLLESQWCPISQEPRVGRYTGDHATISSVNPAAIVLQPANMRAIAHVIFHLLIAVRAAAQTRLSCPASSDSQKRQPNILAGTDAAARHSKSEHTATSSSSCTDSHPSRTASPRSRPAALSAMIKPR
ncbi:hypothetical protein C8035_v012535 [Colletotrichum spinosum]|uniref:Uncharacterized protein n=1 Tax=Colletotrichum spinosum TaxID=1347390 RepID=A0A4R8Q567_9PEZI|nr:hypothetical protein C8035_v012535 [Colletotrichum spinosum]